MEQSTRPKLSVDQTKLLKLWVRKCDEAKLPLPLRKSIGPADFFFCLDKISIVERRTCGSDVFRLTGSALRGILGAECRGQMLMDVCGAMVPWREAMNQALSSSSPVFGYSPAGHLKLHQWMRLPLQKLESGRQPILCYDVIKTVERDLLNRKEAMFVTGAAFSSPQPKELIVA